MLLGRGADANAYEPFNESLHNSEEFYHSPLDAALHNGDDAKTVLKLLLDAGANFKIVDQGRAAIRGISELNKHFTATHSGMKVTEELEYPIADDQMDEDYQEEMYDHLDVLSWVLYPTNIGKEVRETVHALRSAGIGLRFDGISKYSSGRSSRTK
jgi:hypothetical protein